MLNTNREEAAQPFPPIETRGECAVQRRSRDLEIFVLGEQLNRADKPLGRKPLR